MRWFRSRSLAKCRSLTWMQGAAIELSKLFEFTRARALPELNQLKFATIIKQLQECVDITIAAVLAFRPPLGGCSSPRNKRNEGLLLDGCRRSASANATAETEKRWFWWRRRTPARDFQISAAAGAEVRPTRVTSNCELGNILNILNKI